VVEQDEARGLQMLDAALQKYPLDQYPLLDRPYQGLATMYAMLGQPAKAEQFKRLAQQAIPEELRPDDRNMTEFVAGALAMYEKKYAEAIALWRPLSERGTCTICMDRELAIAFERAGMPDSAIARYEHYVNTPNADAVWEDTYKLPIAYERLADLYAQRGDNERAVLYAGKFVSLWENADPELQPRVQAKKEMIRQLRRS
jgi:tetratricopeptide (TPR) repeat protein